MKKISLMMIALFACASLFAESYDDSCEPKPVCPPLPPFCDLPQAPTMGAYNAPARVDVCGSWDFFIQGSFIYWLTYEEGLFVGHINPTDLDTNASQMIDFDYKLKPGFKVAIGGNSDYDDWSGMLQYTWYHFTINNTFNRPAGYTFTSNIGSSVVTTPTVSKDRWNYKYDMLDLDMYRMYYNGKKLTFKTIYGLKGGWLRQTWSNELSSASVTDVPATAFQKSWIIGPKIGINTNWCLGSGFSFFGNAAASLFYQKFSTVSYQSKNTNKTTNAANANYSFSLVNPSAEAFLGFDYGTYFDRNNWHFDLLAGYEIQYLFNQNMFSSSIHKSPLDIMMHGLTVTARFDF